MLKHWYYKIFAGKHLRDGQRQLRQLEGKLPSPEARFAVPFAYRGKGYFRVIEPRQNPVEIEALYRDVCTLKPNRVLEVGTARGGTMYLWCQAAAANATMVSVDLPGGAFGGAYPACRTPFYESFTRDQQRMHLLREDSHQSATLEQVKRLFGDNPIDFAFIDGDHTYEGVKADFEMYGPLVRTGGLIAFHDILPRPEMPEIQVNRFWDEIKDRYETTEHIGPEDSGRRIGIGVVRVTDSSVMQ